MSDELKPCPFCGGVPTVKQAGATRYWWVGCEIHLEPESKGCGISHSSYNKQDAIEKWNTRHNSTQSLLDAYKAGMTEACKVIQNIADGYDAEHGHTDMETGTREYPKNGDEYMLELTEIIESIAAARDNKTKI